ncbi:unnamed protein product [Parajaminaea phylloscopi]
MTWAAFGWTAEQRSKSQQQEGHDVEAVATPMSSAQARGNETPPKSTSTPPTTWQRTHSRRDPPSSEPGEPRPTLEALHLLPLLVMGGGTYLLFAARSRARARVATLKSARDRAIGESAAWKCAYFSSRELPHTAWSARADASTHRPSGSNDVPPTGGFVNSEVAAEAAREQTRALDRGNCFETIGTGLGRLTGLATGRQDPVDDAKTTDGSPRTSSPSAAPHDAKAVGSGAGAAATTAEPSAHSSISTASEEPLQPIDQRSRWQKASSTGPQWEREELAGWEEQAREKEQQHRGSKISRLLGEMETTQQVTLEGQSRTRPYSITSLRQHAGKRNTSHLPAATLEELDRYIYSSYAKSYREAAAEAQERRRESTADLMDPSSPLELELLSDPEPVARRLNEEEVIYWDGREPGEPEEADVEDDFTPARNMDVDDPLRELDYLHPGQIEQLRADRADQDRRDARMEAAIARRKARGPDAYGNPPRIRLGRNARIDDEFRPAYEGADDSIAEQQAARRRREWLRGRPVPGTNMNEADLVEANLKMAMQLLHGAKDQGKSTSQESVTSAKVAATVPSAGDQMTSLEGQVEQLKGQVKAMEAQLGRMNVWADQVHRKIGCEGSYPGSLDRP